MEIRRAAMLFERCRRRRVPRGGGWAWVDGDSTARLPFLLNQELTPPRVYRIASRALFGRTLRKPSSSQREPGCGRALLGSDAPGAFARPAGCFRSWSGPCAAIRPSLCQSWADRGCLSFLQNFRLVNGFPGLGRTLLSHRLSFGTFSQVGFFCGLLGIEKPFTKRKSLRDRIPGTSKNRHLSGILSGDGAVRVERLVRSRRETLEPAWRRR